MEKLLTELNKIYTKLGGQESDIPATKKNDLEFIIDKIEDKVGSGGGESDLYIVNFTLSDYNEETDIYDTVTSDKTAEEIQAACESGKLVLGYAVFWDGDSYKSKCFTIDFDSYSGANLRFCHLDFSNAFMDDRFYTDMIEPISNSEWIYNNSHRWYPNYLMVFLRRWGDAYTISSSVNISDITNTYDLPIIIACVENREYYYSTYIDRANSFVVFTGVIDNNGTLVQRTLKWTESGITYTDTNL